MLTTDIAGDFTPIRVNYGDEPFVILVGHAGGGLEWVRANGAKCALDESGRWTSPPLPYQPGMTVEVVYSAGRSIRAELPGPDKLVPVFGPGWVSYAPLADD